MKVVFRSKDFVSIEGAGFGFNNRRPLPDSWQYHGRVQHRDWQGLFECAWENAGDARHIPELLWTVHGDARMFKLAAALKSQGYHVAVLQDDEEIGKNV